MGFLEKMKKIILLIIILGLITIPSIASAINVDAKPSSYVPLQLNQYTITTHGLPFAAWKPAFIKWYLIDPFGKSVYMIDKPLDSVSKTGGGLLDSTWEITTDSGLVEIPAFATTGLWTVRGKLYDINRIFIIQWSNEAIVDIATINVVEGSFVDSLNAPIYIYWDISGFELSFAIPDLIFLIAFIVIIFVLLINIRLFIVKGRMKSYGG